MHRRLLISRRSFLFLAILPWRKSELLWTAPNKSREDSEKNQRGFACTVVSPIPTDSAVSQTTKLNPHRPRPVRRTYTVNLMELYTPKAVADNGGEDNIQAKIRRAVDNLNMDARSSGMWNVYFQLAYMGQFNVTSNSGFEVVKDMPSNMEIAWRRDFYGAHLVGIWMEDGSYAFLPNVDNPDPNQGFHVISSNQDWNSHLLSHEIGHNFGMQHDEKDTPVYPGERYPWARGFCNETEPKFRCIMAVSCPPPEYPLIRHFSNPDVYYMGVPTGVRDRADNVRMFRMTLPAIANYR